MSEGPTLQFRLAAHQVRPTALVVEVWYAGAFVAEITAVPGAPILRVISKHVLGVDESSDIVANVVAIEVQV